MSTQLDRVLLLGIGTTGRELAAYLIKHKIAKDVCLYAGTASGKDVNKWAQKLENMGVHVVMGTEVVEGSYDLCIASPGISENCSFYLSAKAASTEIIGEPEFAWHQHPEGWYAITGTNGKTTTTTLVKDMLLAAGMDAMAVGNIGKLCTTAVDTASVDTVFAAELSSFQLAGTKLFHPKVAVLLNITPDHIEWHGSIDAYAKAKAKIFANQTKDDAAIVSVDDEYSRKVFSELKDLGRRVIALSVDANFESEKYAEAAYLAGDKLYIKLAQKTILLATTAELPIKGIHNAQNILAAATVAYLAGASLEAIRKAIFAFKPLSHRNEFVATIAGVDYINDSKATNTDSVEAALTAYEPKKVILLLGGHDKGTELDSFAEKVVASCRAAICYGEAGPRIYAALDKNNEKGELELYSANHMRDAFELAVGLARSGETVLLSPACSSFDEFKNMAERGNLFKELVHTLQKDARESK